MKHSQGDQDFHTLNIKALREQLTQSDAKCKDLLQYLQKEYPPNSMKINLGSIYQIPIEAKGVELLTKYWFWNIEMINLTYHKIENEGLQYLIKRANKQFTQTQKNYQQWTQLTELSIIKNNLTSQAFEGIEKANLLNFKVLRVSNNRIDHVAIYKFVQSDWPNLIELQCGNNKIGKQGCKLLMISKWKNFKRLDLNYNLIQNEGVHYLSEADWPQLTQINLSNNKIDASATFYFKNANWPKLKSLMLNKNYIGKIKEKCSNVGCQNICLMKTNSIEKLSLYGNQITLNGISIILKSKKLLPGCFLELSRNHFKFQDIKDFLKQYDKFCNQFEN